MIYTFDETYSADDVRYMKEALALAKKALKRKEVPIGCVIAFEGRIIARGYNTRNNKKCALRHAEVSAIEKASRVIGDWRLEGCALYVTVEPCPMCAGAIVQARIPKVIYGAKNPRAGCAGSIYNLFDEPRFNHRVACLNGLLAEDSAALMREFFKICREEESLGVSKNTTG